MSDSQNPHFTYLPSVEKVLVIEGNTSLVQIVHVSGDSVLIRLVAMLCWSVITHMHLYKHPSHAHRPPFTPHLQYLHTFHTLHPSQHTFSITLYTPPPFACASHTLNHTPPSFTPSTPSTLPPLHPLHLPHPLHLHPSHHHPPHRTCTPSTSALTSHFPYLHTYTCIVLYV